MSTLRFSTITGVITVPTLFTFARFVCVPLIVLAMIGGQWGYAFGLFLTACATDILDGYFARLLNCQTFFGACFDAITDKLLLISCFACLACITTPLFSIPLWFVLYVLLKESILVLGGAWIYFKKGALEVQPTMLGKTTTFVQLLFITWLFACYFFHWLPIKTYHVMLWMLGVLIGLCLVQYVYKGWRYYYGVPG